MTPNNFLTQVHIFEMDVLKALPLVVSQLVIKSSSNTFLYIIQLLLDELSQGEVSPLHSIIQLSNSNFNLLNVLELQYCCTQPANRSNSSFSYFQTHNHIVIAPVSHSNPVITALMYLICCNIKTIKRAQFLSKSLFSYFLASYRMKFCTCSLT